VLADCTRWRYDGSLFHARGLATAKTADIISQVYEVIITNAVVHLCFCIIITWKLH